MSKYSLVHFTLREEGATAVEYAVMLALIILVCITSITMVGGEAFNFWSNNRDQLQTHLP